MKKSDLVAALAAQTGTTKQDAGQFLAAIKQIAETEIAGGRTFEIHGVVNLTVQTRGARLGRNPATGAVVEIPEKRVVKPRVPSSLSQLAG